MPCRCLSGENKHHRSSITSSLQFFTSPPSSTHAAPRRSLQPSIGPTIAQNCSYPSLSLSACCLTRPAVHPPGSTTRKPLIPPRYYLAFHATACTSVSNTHLGKVESLVEPSRRDSSITCTAALRAIRNNLTDDWCNS